MADLIIFNASGTLGIHTIATFIECVKIIPKSYILQFTKKILTENRLFHSYVDL